MRFWFGLFVSVWWSSNARRVQTVLTRLDKLFSSGQRNLEDAGHLQQFLFAFDPTSISRSHRSRAASPYASPKALSSVFRLGKYGNMQSTPTMSSSKEVQSRMDPHSEGFAATAPFRVVSFNVLAPCYHRLQNSRNSEESQANASLQKCVAKDGIIHFESNDEAHFEDRNKCIISELEKTNADIILLQEYWVANEHLKQLYVDRLGEEFDFVSVQRSSHWRERDDGLACFVRRKKVAIQDSQDIIFHDCADRVAKMLLVAVAPAERHLPPRQLIVVNTHLLFPHNDYSTQIRKREVAKIVGFVEGYQKKKGIRVPVVIAGDFNGSPDGAVQTLLRQQLYKNAYMNYTGKREWISHKTHRKTTIPVDHVMFLNPSEQRQGNSTSPDWLNLVYQEMYTEIVKKYPGAVDALREAFSDVDHDSNHCITLDEFQEYLSSLGFAGEGRPALTPEEVEQLVMSADENGDGCIDFKEFLDRFWIARNTHLSDISDTLDSSAMFDWMRGESNKKDQVEQTLNTFAADLDSEWHYARPCGDLTVKDAKLYPPLLEDGQWPHDWTLSDHGMVIIDFVGSKMSEEKEMHKN